MSSYISFLDTQKRELVSVRVPENVKRYVMQLEVAIKYPSRSKLLDIHVHLRQKKNANPYVKECPDGVFE